ncbi:hypothetical protein LCGC14_3110000, partial [marine sediment metagenome]
LSAAIRDYGHKPHILDFSVLDVPEDGEARTTFLEDICNYKIEEIGTKLVGINCFTTMHFHLVDELVKLIKKHNPAVKICLGGAHPTYFGEDILSNCEYVDYIVAGEGEEALIGLAQIIGDGPRITKETEISNIPALIYRDKNGSPVQNPVNASGKAVTTVGCRSTKNGSHWKCAAIYFFRQPDPSEQKGTALSTPYRAGCSRRSRSADVTR